MLLNNSININQIKKLRLGVLAIICFATSACSSIDISYISRQEAKKASFNQERPLYVEKKPLSLGALRFKKAGAKEDDPGQIFFLQRKKGTYMAETMVRGDGKTRYFFSLGVDVRTRTPAVGFKMEF